MKSAKKTRVKILLDKPFLVKIYRMTTVLAVKVIS